MEHSPFNLNYQQNDPASKLVLSLERISEAFRVLLWQHAKVIGLSPIQIQLLIFIAHHPAHLCKVSHLAQEFNLTKATVSDAVRVLVLKGLAEKNVSAEDKRAYTLHLTQSGREIVTQTENFPLPIYEALAQESEDTQTELLLALSKLVYALNQKGILSVQRTCWNCRFYEAQFKGHYCHFMHKPLKDSEIRLDCLEFEEKESA